MHFPRIRLVCLLTDGEPGGRQESNRCEVRLTNAAEFVCAEVNVDPVLVAARRFGKLIAAGRDIAESGSSRDDQICFANPFGQVFGLAPAKRSRGLMVVATDGRTLQCPHSRTESTPE
jgi:hypothetical protein